MGDEHDRIVVVGAGVAGLATALALGRAGWPVTLIERDATPLPADPAAAFAWDRRGAPQVRHSHAFLARLRNLLRDRFPDVLDDLFAAGATEIRFCDLLPPEIEDRAARPGDEDLVALACRRTTFEWVLRRAVLATALVELRDGAEVIGIDGTARVGEQPAEVHGVVVRVGDTEERLDARLVVVAGGRRAALGEWYRSLGAELEEVTEDTGIIYLSRFYRLADHGAFPESTGPIGGDLGYLKYGVFQGDNATFSVTMALANDDAELRALLLDPDTFDRNAGVLPATAPWVAGAPEPLTGVNVMAKLVNRRRTFTDAAHRPLVHGLVAVGDAHTCTNPLYGRGCSLAFVQATILADALAADGADRGAAQAAYEAASDREILPWYEASVSADRQGRAWLRWMRAQERRASDAPATTADGDATEVVAASVDPSEPGPDAFVVELLRDGVMPTVRRDAEVFRAFIRVFNLLAAPQELMADPGILATVMAAYQDRHQRPPEAPLGPPRRELVAALTA